MTVPPIDLSRFAQNALAARDFWRADSAARLLGASANRAHEAAPLRAEIADKLGLTGWRDLDRPPDGGKFLLIPACGAGFWADAAHVLGALLLAEITGRTPIVHWGAASRFRAPDLGDADAFGQFFEPIAPVSLGALASIADRWPLDWPLDPPPSSVTPPKDCDPLQTLARRETLVIAASYLPLADMADWIPHGHPLRDLTLGELARKLLADHVRIRPAIKAAADALIAATFGDVPFVSAHVRGTDKNEEVPNNDKLIDSYLIWTDRMLQHPEQRLFLATDDARCADLFQRRYGARLGMSDATRRSDGLGVHAAPGDAGRRLGEELLIDCLVAVEGVHFVGNGTSGPSCAIALMRRRPPASCTLFGESFWLREDMALLMR
jgi:protein O-GlcNAc transferase